MKRTYPYFVIVYRFNANPVIKLLKKDVAIKNGWIAEKDGMVEISDTSKEVLVVGFDNILEAKKFAETLYYNSVQIIWKSGCNMFYKQPKE